MVFGVYSDTPVEVSTNLRLYFGFGTDSVSSFSLSLKKLNASWPQDSSTSLTGSGVNIDLINYNSYGTVVGYTSIKTTVQTNRDTSDENTIYSWTWFNSSALSYSGVMVTIPFQSFILANSPLYFEMLNFDVNGEQTSFSATEQDVHNIAQVITEDPAPDLSIDPIDVPDVSAINAEASKSVDNINTFITYFDIGGAMQRTLGQFSNYMLVQPTDGSVGHQMIVYIGWFSLAAIFIIWLVSSLKRRDGGG